MAASSPRPGVAQACTMGADEVRWLLEELNNFNGAELVEAISGARHAVALFRSKLKRKRQTEADATTQKKPLRPQRSSLGLDGGAVLEGASRFARIWRPSGAADVLSSNAARSTETLTDGADKYRAATIDELRGRLLADAATGEKPGHLKGALAHSASMESTASARDVDDDADATKAATATVSSAVPAVFGPASEVDIDALHGEAEQRRGECECDDDTAEREAEAGRRAVELLWQGGDPATTRPADAAPPTGTTTPTTPQHPKSSLAARTRGALMKTVRNDHWPAFASLLKKTLKKHARPFYTPTSLAPRGCVGMRLFGRVWAQSCGVVLSREALELPDDVWAWRSGFFAKTEFGVTSKTTEDKTLRPDLAAALASLEELEAMAARREYEHFGTLRVADDVAPYNEVFAAIKPHAVVAVFARTTQPQHLLMAMGARDLLQRLVNRTPGATTTTAAASGASSTGGGGTGDAVLATRGLKPPKDALVPPRPRRIAVLVIDAGGATPPKVVPLSAQAALLRKVAASESPFLSG
eukprot:CAMPEP_0185714334 /NCGR_PEP_ID=MMETSP1164-20130828/38551_1 /TAXON_ID=1104430 /ORGANISM="Chrysoreinhardia sp, Strain CCMP2950" /LENGTH=529 /DNA_ID=CAMNT_0028381913 /DNA_START=23 /DNA_END=1609 /DNA_ORIENTATION=+